MEWRGWICGEVWRTGQVAREEWAARLFEPLELPQTSCQVVWPDETPTVASVGVIDSGQSCGGQWPVLDRRRKTVTVIVA